MFKNWVGLEPHPTDELVHWSERDPKALMLELRPKYDMIVNLGPEYKAALNELLSAQRDVTMDNVAESAAGEDL